MTPNEKVEKLSESTWGEVLEQCLKTVREVLTCDICSGHEFDYIKQQLDLRTGKTGVDQMFWKCADCGVEKTVEYPL